MSGPESFYKIAHSPISFSSQAFDSMFNDIKSLFLKHSSKDVIEKCVLSLVHLKGVKEDSEDQEGEDGEEDTAAGTSSISTTPARRGGKTVKGMKSKKKKTSLSFNSSNDNITATGPSTLADLHDSVMLKLYSLAEATLTELDELQIDLKASVNESIESSQEFAEIVIDLDVRNVSLVTASVQRLFSLYRFIDMTDCKSSRQRDEPDISSSSSSNEEEDESSVFSIINAVLDSVLSLNKLIAPLTTPTASTSSEAASLSTKNLKKAWSVKLVLEDTLEMCFGVLFIDMIQEVHHAGGKQQSGNEGEVAARNASGDYAAAAVAASSATLSSHLERFKEKSDHLSKVMEAIVVGPYDWDLTDKADAESDFSPFSVNVKLAAMNVLTDLFCVCNGPLSLNFPSIARRAPSDLQLGSARLMSTCLDLLCFSEPSMDVISAAPLQPSQSPSLPLMSLEKRGALGHRLLKMCAKMWKLPQLAVFSPAHLSTLLACMGIKSPSSGDVVYGARLLAEIEQQPTADAMRGVSLNVFGTMWDKITTAIGQDVVAHLWDTIMFDHTGLGASKDCDEQEDAELMLMDEEGNIGQQQNAKARRQQIEKSLRDFSRLVFNSLEQVMKKLGPRERLSLSPKRTIASLSLSRPSSSISAAVSRPLNLVSSYAPLSSNK